MLSQEACSRMPTPFSLPSSKRSWLRDIQPTDLESALLMTFSVTRPQVRPLIGFSLRLESQPSHPSLAQMTPRRTISDLTHQS